MSRSNRLGCAALVGLLWLAPTPLRAQTTLLSEGFEGNFPADNGWSVGDDNPSGVTAFWDDKNSLFGGEGTHSGSWKGYCAGSLYPLSSTEPNPAYQDHMTAFMQRSVDLTGFASAELRFWYKLPSLEPCCDRARVLVDGSPVWITGAPVTLWTEQIISLNAYLGGAHTIRFEFTSDFSGTGEGWYLDDILVTGTAPPANDSFVNATTITGASGNLSGTTTFATKEAGEPNHDGNAGGHSIWYRWTAPSAGAFTFFTLSSSFDTLLAIYTGASVNSLTRIASDDDVPGGNWSGVTIEATPGTTYYIAIDGFNGASGSTVLNWLQPTVTETILSSAVANYTGYVIDSDPARDYIQVDASVRSDNLSFITQPTIYRLVFRLLDAANNPHPIFDENGLSSTTYGVSNELVLAGLASFTANLSGFLRPAAPLDRYQQYHVETRVFRFTSGGPAFNDAPNFYTHFTNRVSGDLSYNVIGVLVSAPFTRAYAIKTAPGKTAFAVQPFFGLYRYDNFAGANVADAIPIAFDCVLSNATTGGTVPLKQSRVTANVTVDSYQPGIPIAPRFVTPAVSVELEPQDSVQLDSVNHLFKAYLGLSISNTPGQPAVAANRAASPDQRLLHFNGKILFGDIETQFTGIGNVPPVNLVSAPTSVASELAVSAGAGSIMGKSSYTYGGGPPLAVDLLVNGDARYTGAACVPLTFPPANDEVAHVRFRNLSACLNSLGAFANVRVWLPTGFGYRFTDTAGRRILGTHDFAGARLTPMLRPAMDLSFGPLIPGERLFACEESKPFWIEAMSITWHVNTGTFEIGATGNLKYVRAEELTQLETAPVAPDLRTKPSNDQYFRRATSLDVTVPPTVSADASGNALLSCRVNFGVEPAGYNAHFPYGARLQWNSGTMVISNDLVDTTASSLDGMQPVALDYARDCGLPTPCPGAIGDASLTLATAANVSFTVDGGLAAPGTFSAPVAVEWGWVSKVGRYAQRSFNYSQAGFHMPGIFLRGDQTTEPKDHRAALLLYTGANASNVTHIERYGTSGYQDGFTDYAGFNFRVGSNGAKQGESTLAGEPSGTYQLTGRSKYYVRPGGISGIHEAVIGTFPGTMTLYGYIVDFSNYGLSYLDSQNKDSRTIGDIKVPYPSRFTQEFEEMRFTCLGALESAKVPANSGDKPLEYWQGKFKPLAIQFETDQCDPTDGLFTMGIGTSVAHVPTQLFGRMGFLPSGQIANKGDPKGAKYNVSSRLKLPNRLTLKGPAEENYEFSVVTEAYFNHEADAPQTNGWVNWAGTIDVPFFENIKTHLHTSANTNTSNPPIHLMGGWPANGWGTPLNNFFTDPNTFDLNHRSYDGGSLAIYRDNTGGDKYHPRAQQSWLNVINFDYPLTWSSSTRSFTSSQPEKEKFLVVEISHQVKYLSAQNAELTFGLEYGGVPKISLANVAFNALNEVTGVQTAISNTIGSVSHKVIDEAFKSLDNVLNAQLRNLFEPVFAEVMDPFIDQLYSQLAVAYAALPNPAAGVWYTNVPVISSLLSYSNSISVNFSDATAAAKEVISQVSNTLAQVDNALTNIQGIIATNTEGKREISRKLIQNLVGQLAASFIGSFTDPLLNEMLKGVDPTLRQIDKTLAELRHAVAEARSKLEAAGNFSAELQVQFTAPTAVAEFAKVADHVRSDLTNVLAHLDTSFNPFTEQSAQQFKTLVRHKLEDRFFATAVSANIQKALKERLYDLDASIRESVDSVFQQFNGIMREIIAKSLAEVDKSINKCLGPFGNAMGHGQINGYAHIKGDSLNLLRLDGHFQWKVPDAMEFKAFLQIKELVSDGSASCSVPGEKATEVTVGAKDVAVKWISPDLRASISGKFSFVSSPDVTPLGMGGAFELTGPLNFASFQITELGATMAFGALENYLGAKARVKFNQYEFAGGIFFGKTCTLEPLLLVDKDVADVLPPPVLTGAYVFAEGWFPINEALGIPSSCFFNVRVGLGAGAFFFLAGDQQVPTFGGKMKLGVSGEVLCLIYVKGQVLLVGVKSGDDLVFKGRGDLAARIGFCPFCLEFSKSIGMKYQKGWSVDF